MESQKDLSNEDVNLNFFQLFLLYQAIFLKLSAFNRIKNKISIAYLQTMYL
jgi:hypothetical protein